MAWRSRHGIGGARWRPVRFSVTSKRIIARNRALLYYYAYIASGNSKAACVAAASVPLWPPLLLACVHKMFGYVFLLLTLICLEHFRRGSRFALLVFATANS